MQVTSLDQIRNAMADEIVELPPFGGTPFYARLRRLSLLGLAGAGHIPNPLLPVAAGLFTGKLAQEDNKMNLADMGAVFRIIAEHALVEPTLAEIEDAGAALTDLQLVAIYNYTQLGPKSLAGFRGVPADNKGAEPEQAI